MKQLLSSMQACTPLNLSVELIAFMSCSPKQGAVITRRILSLSRQRCCATLMKCGFSRVARYADNGTSSRFSLFSRVSRVFWGRKQRGARPIIPAVVITNTGLACGRDPKGAVCLHSIGVYSCDRGFRTNSGPLTAYSKAYQSFVSQEGCLSGSNQT